MGNLSKGIIRAVISGVSRSKVSVVGAVLSLVLLPVLLVSIFIDFQGMTQNPYFGFLIYLIMGPLFTLGLILVCYGIVTSKGREDIGVFTYEYLEEQFSRPGRFTRVRKLIGLTTGIAFISLFIIGLVTYTGYHYTESNSFCGQFCHNVMEPEFVTYKNSPHSRVSCVECHIGKDSGWFTKAKFSGVKQLVATAMNSHSKPLVTPIEALRPVRETCEQCHRPEKFHGDKLHVRESFLPDEKNTQVQTALLVKIGSGGYSGREAHGIHWHVSEKYKVSYVHTDRSREQISRVILTGPDDFKEVYYSSRPVSETIENIEGLGTVQESLREMDCIDCHNRPTHIFLSPEKALDRKLTTGIIPRDLPFIKKQGLAVITKMYGTADSARLNIAKQLRSWYQENYPKIYENKREVIDQAIKGVQQAYSDNVFPEMKIGWKTYKNFIGHEDGTGCFRCHDGSHATKEGKVISKKCETCHVLLAVDEQSPDILQVLKGVTN